VPATEPIRVRKETKEELNRLKVHPRETYDDVITGSSRSTRGVGMRRANVVKLVVDKGTH